MTTPPSHQAKCVVAPEIVISHTPDRCFIGPGTIRLENGDILMAAPWSRPPTNFEQLAATFPVPTLCRSADGGRTWREQGRLKIEWALKGMVSDRGISFLRLKDGRLSTVLPRHAAQPGGVLSAHAARLSPLGRRPRDLVTPEGMFVFSGVPERPAVTEAGSIRGPSFECDSETWRQAGATMGISVFGCSCDVKDGS